MRWWSFLFGFFVRGGDRVLCLVGFGIFLRGESSMFSFVWVFCLILIYLFEFLKMFSKQERVNIGLKTKFRNLQKE